MATQWQRVTIRIPVEYGPEDRQSIGRAIVKFIRKRTKDGLDKNNRPFARYSKSYIQSLNFKIARKSKGDVNLVQSGDMLGALDVLSDAPGRITIGFERGSLENGIADGNIRGTYGHSYQVGPRRDFLGITKSDLQSILDQFPITQDRSQQTFITQAISDFFNRFNRPTGQPVYSTFGGEEDA